MLESLVPFQHMLQAALAPLLAPAQHGAGGAAASLPLLLKLLARMKATEDSAVRGAFALGVFGRGRALKVVAILRVLWGV
jgi:hypothetical protein